MTMLRLVSWNINQRPEAWHDLVASTEYDIALLQEAKPPPVALASQVQIDSAPPWMTAGSALLPEFEIPRFGAD